MEGNSDIVLDVASMSEDDINCSGASDMVRVRHAYKAYGPRSQVLKGLNLTVQQGSIFPKGKSAIEVVHDVILENISSNVHRSSTLEMMKIRYAFLGPSGCGKTTLLACLVGRKLLDAGEIKLGITYYHELGYMPQEKALLNSLTIEETINFYGKIFGMKRENIIKRLNQLLNFLDLPPKNRQIVTLSGGQQRRVSLCITLLHEPKLLILDEPTVGVDPILSDKIWNYLGELTNEGKTTVLLTTHYIEEARLANRVGMMRDGVLLEEGNPQKILKDYNCCRLEDVFLKLCEMQDLGEKPCTMKITHLQTSPRKEQKPTTKRKDSFSIYRVIALLFKTFFYFKQNMRIISFVILLPLVQNCLMHFTIGHRPHSLDFGIVNEELVHGRSDCQAYYNCSWAHPISCLYMNVVEKQGIKLTLYDNIETARTDLMKNYIWGFMHITHNYTKALKVKSDWGLKTDDNSVNMSTVNIWLDESNEYNANFLKSILYSAYEVFLLNVYEECGWPVKAAKIPIDYQKPIHGSIHDDFTEFILPCGIIISSFYMPMLLVTASLLAEKQDGLLERSFVSGVTLVETIMCQAIITVIILLIQIFGMMSEVYLVLNHSLVGSTFLAFLICFLVGISGMCYGFMISVICDRDITATFLGIGSFFPLVFLSGMIWPREGMHYLLQSIAWALPLTIVTDSYRSVTSRGWGITNPLVYEGILLSLLWAIVFCLGSYFFGKIKKLVNVRNFH